MKKILLICIIIVGITFVSGCIGGEKVTDSTGATPGNRNSEVYAPEPPHGTAIPSQNSGQKTTFISKFDKTIIPDFNINGAQEQGMAINNIPPMVYFDRKRIYIKNLANKGDDYLYGFIGSTLKFDTTASINFAFFDENGNYINPGKGSNGGYNIGPSFQQFETTWTNPTTDIVGVPKGLELSFRVAIPEKTEYIRIQGW